MRWFAVAVLVFAALCVVAPASAVDLPSLLDPCNNTDAPIPASPQGPASLTVRVTKPAKDADPFADPDDLSIESVYGTTPQWWTYDNGCTGQFVAGAGTALGNMLLEISGLLPNWTHALLHTVIAPGSWLRELEQPVLDALDATRAGVWTPWLPVVVLAVAVVVLLRARGGRVAGSVNAAAWALLILVGTSWILNYPSDSIRMVDSGVRTATTLIASGFDTSDATDRSADAVMARQMDQVVRSTQYRTWLTGAFGDPNTGTATTYGPRLFDATHFTWDEYETYRDDPQGKGRRIVEAKADAFQEIAERVKADDPRAYEYFRGGKWSQRSTTAFVNAVIVVIVCGYLLVAGVSILLAFALIRLLVPIAPVAGVLFMIDHTRDMAVGMLRRVVGPLVMGPVCLLLGLVLLRFDSVILATTMWFPVKLAIIGGLVVIAWTFTRPGAYSVRPLWHGLRAGASFVGGLHGHRSTHVEPAIRRLEAGIATSGLPAGGARPMAAGRPFLPGIDDRLDDGPARIPAMPPPAPAAALPGPSATSRTPAKTQYEWPIGPHPLIRATKKYPPPPVAQTVQTNALGPRTKFPSVGFALEPHTAYLVPGRGTYYTGDDPTVVHVETDFGTKGNLNWDLNYPAPSTTYVVGDRFRYVTDEETRTIRADDVQARAEKAYRSDSIQAAVGRAAGEGYDGGHLHQNAHAGGAERINLVAMLEELNRSGSKEYGSIPNSFYQFEAELRRMVSAGRNVEIDLYVDYPENRTSRTPLMIHAEYRIDGGRPKRKDFENVRDE